MDGKKNMGGRKIFEKEKFEARIEWKKGDLEGRMDGKREIIEEKIDWR